jgi:hypothetical protein
MAAVRATIDQIAGDLLELSEDPDRQRWQAFDETHSAVNLRCDALMGILNDRVLWKAASVSPAVAEIHMRMMAELTLMIESLKRLGYAKSVCSLKQAELKANTTIIALKAIEGHLAYRPPEVVVAARPGARIRDLFAMPTTRVDLFNQGLGEVQPPPGPADINDGYADPNAEDMTGVVRPRPLVRPDLVKDPTNSIQISNM